MDSSTVVQKLPLEADSYSVGQRPDRLWDPHSLCQVGAGGKAVWS